MLFNRKVPLLHLLKGFCDYHTHLLHGVDDGVSTLEESLAALEYFESAGLCRVYLTPHIMADMASDKSFLCSRFDELRAAYRGGMELHLAAEYMLDTNFFRLLDRGELLPLNDNHLLVEISYAQQVVDLEDSVKRIMSSGYFVVLAHPERYLYLSRDDYRSLKSLGVKFQLNFPSLCGLYGADVRDRARWLLAQSYYNVVGSDIHSFGSYSQLMDKATVSRSLMAQLTAISNEL